MALHKNNICYLTIIIFIIPIIVLPAIILSVKIETSDLESIISSLEPFSSECYNLTYSFIIKQKSDERYSSLHSYLKSFIPVCIVIIITYSLKIIYSICFAMLVEEDMRDGANGMYLCYFDAPARILSFIPLIVCVILLRIRSYTNKCEEFMNYYDLCSSYYGDNFKNNFSDIMDIKTYTLSIVILFVWEIVYHFIVVLYIGNQ